MRETKIESLGSREIAGRTTLASIVKCNAARKTCSQIERHLKTAQWYARGGGLRRVLRAEIQMCLETLAAVRRKEGCQ
jgi:hypothetical protein